MRLRSVFKVLLVLLACAVLLGPLQNQLLAQESRGTIVGTVTDPSGAVVPGASVVLVSKTMGTRVAVTANDAGAFQASFLLPGAYQVTVEQPGFKKYVRDVEVRVNSRLELTLALEVGAPTESVTVTAETPLLNTASATIGDIIDGRRVAELPLTHGQPFILAGLAAGISFNAQNATLNRPFEPTHIAGYAMDGVRQNRSDITIDGIASTAISGPGTVISSYVPPTDIVQEFRVQTATFDAQFGNTEGGVINMSIKSGTNAVHGTALFAKWFPSITANDWFSNRAGGKLANFIYNRWGGTAGGPLWIPKIYNGKNRTFWLWGYEAIHETRPRNNCQGNNAACAVPTAAEWNGDFSSQLAFKSALQIYNPFSATLGAGNIVTRSPFTGNIIPPNMITAQAKTLRTYWPTDPYTPSLGARDDTNNSNDSNLTEPVTYYTHTFRVDQNVSDKQRIFARVSFYNRTSNYNDYFHTIATGEWFSFISRNAVFDDVYTLTPTTVLNVKYGYNRFIRVSNSNPGGYGVDLTTLGFSKTFQDQVVAGEQPRFPGIAMQGYTTTDHSDFFMPCDIHSFAGTLTKMLRSHAIKVGMEVRVYRMNERFFGNDGVGRLIFNGTYTDAASNASPPNPAMGLSVASLLLGIPSSGSITRLASFAEQSPSWGVFFQDDWKVSRKLTLNLGVRWEFEQPLTERYNRSITSFDTTYVQSFDAAARAAYAAIALKELPASQFSAHGGVLFADVGGQSRNLYPTPKRQFAPRFGFAYQVSDKTVVRGGYGIFFGFLGQRQKIVQQLGYNGITSITPTNDNGLTFVATVANPFPTGVNAAVGNGEAGATALNQNITFFNQNPLTPYNQRWQLGFQRQLPGGFVLDTAYVGSRGTRIEMNRDINTVPRQFMSTLPFRDNAWRTYMVGTVANPFKGLLTGTAANNSLNTSSTITRAQLLRPFPEFGSVTTSTNQGYTWYHSLQVTAQKRFSKGYTLAAAYTYSKFMQATEYLNASDPMPLETISDNDTPHRIIVSSIWELPFGRGKKMGGNVNPFFSQIISGWQLEGIYCYQSSRPIGFSNDMFFGDSSQIRYTGAMQTVDHWFNNTAAAGWVTNAANVLDTGNQLRTFPLRFGTIRWDPLNNFDLSTLKNFRVAEGKAFQFRFEAINALNHPNFNTPDGNATSANFGKVTAIQNYTRRLQFTFKFVF